MTAVRATINDVATLARVSIKTVSRVTNREPNVRAATRARVDKAIAALDYRPSPAARNLATQRSFVIGLLYDDRSATVSYITGIQSGILDAVERARYQMLIHRCNFDQPSLASDVIELVRRSHLEGLILTPPLSDVSKLARALDNEGIDYVKIAPGVRTAPGKGVYSNDRVICAQMTQYLASLGHTRIGFITGHPQHIIVGTRFSGYRDGLAASRLPFDPGLVATGLNSFESGIVCGRQLLTRRRRPTAIFASNDEMAAGVLRVAHELGIAVPADLSIAGFDDIPLARQTWPSLTTIRQPISELAERAAELLLARLSNQPTPNRNDNIIESVLVLRDSTGGEQRP